MPPHRWLLVILAGLAFVAWPAPRSTVRAAGSTLRLATLAPRGSSPERVLRAWNHTLKTRTHGALSFRLYAGGVAGDERDVLRKMRVGQMDGGGFSGVGLVQVARPVSLLQMTGLYDDYAALNRVRDTTADTWRELFDQQGYTLLGWADIGPGRVFSNRPILRPSDYKQVRPWIPRGEPLLPEMYRIIGANGVTLGIPEVLPALQTGMVDTVLVPASAAVALQWFRHTTHVGNSSIGNYIVGATILRKEVYDGLPPDHREALDETGKQAEAQLKKLIEKEDAASMRVLLGRGMQSFDPLADPAHAKEWTRLSEQLAERTNGKLWPRELYERVRQLAGH